MDRNLYTTSSLWRIIILISASKLTESRLLHDRSPSSATTNSRIQYRTDIRPERTEVRQQQSEGLSVRPRPVAVNCHANSMRVVVRADLFDTGIQVDGRDLRLGSDSVSEGSVCGAVPSGEAEFTIQVHLMDCGAKLSSTTEKIIYSNVLVYSPVPSSEGLLRLDGAVIPVECHYEKRYAVDGISLHPTWLPSVSIVSADDQIDFNLLLMTDDWQFERESYSYFLGDPILFEVSAIVTNHMPLRVYVDRCVATPTPDAEATLSYAFIDHYGCLADAYLTNSNSRFLPRVEEHKLRFQLEAFRFYQEPSKQVYITCYVKAVPVVLSVSSQNRACSMIENRWRSVDGNDQACSSCDRSHLDQEPLPTEPAKTTTRKAWPSKASQESSAENRPEHFPANYVSYRPGMYQSQQNQPQQSSAGVMKRGAEYKSERTIQLGPITVLPFSKTDTIPSDSKMVPSPKNRN